MVGGQYDFITFYGRHAMERNIQRMPVGHGVQEDRQPERILQPPVQSGGHRMAERETTEDAGGCWCHEHLSTAAASRVRSAQDQYYQTRLLMGFPEEQFAYPLACGRGIPGAGSDHELFLRGTGKTLPEPAPLYPDPSVPRQIQGSRTTDPSKQLGGVLF